MMNAEAENSVIARLLARMEKAPGFAGLGSSVQTISEIGDDLDAGTRRIVDVILRDAALTAKLLRLANSTRSGGGGRNVSTIDQAIVILGLNTVKSVALSLALLGSLSSKPQSKQLHAEIVAAYFCGSFASQITRANGPRFSAQEAQVCGLLQNLGRMMATYYLYEEIERSREVQAANNLSEEDAIGQTMGTSFQAIGAAIVGHWCLPDVLQKSLATGVGKAAPRSATTAVEWQQLCALFARRITDTLFRLPENRERIEIAGEIEFFRGALHLKDDEVREWIGQTLADTDAMLSGISFPCTVEPARTLLRKASERVSDVLSAQDRLTHDAKSMEGRKPIEVIHYLLRLIHDRLNFDRTLLCVPDGSNGLVAIAGVGRNAQQVTGRFRCHGPKPDIFRVIMDKKLDTFIADVRTSPAAKLMPAWYPEVVGANSFVVLSLVRDGKVLGVLYGDYPEPPASPPQELAQGAMKEWRDQLIVALLAGAR